jgi:hypothetical protein
MRVVFAAAERVGLWRKSEENEEVVQGVYGYGHMIKFPVAIGMRRKTERAADLGEGCGEH